MTGATMRRRDEPVARRRDEPVSRRRRGEGGFSLIEIIFALTFLAVGILAVASMIPAGTRGVTVTGTGL